ncbi:MAG TPA: NADPH:quinone oxidoreductase family protein [Mycobacterium sp.]
MRAVHVTRLDGPESVEVVDIAEPTAGADQVLIDVHAAGVAFPDVLQTRGLYQVKPPLPFIPGTEVAGVVRSAPGGARVSPGDRVVGLAVTGGAMAEVVALQTDSVFALPDNVSMAAGAGLLFNDLTVHFALRHRAQIQPHETVLVHGAAGGIGTSTLRMSAALGAERRIAVVSTAAKADHARSAGATDVVLSDGWLAAVKELTSGRGVDVVVDPVGGERFTDSIRSLAPAGRLLVVGFTGGDIPTVKVNRLLLNNVSVVGVGWGAWLMTHPAYISRQWREVEALLASGRLAVPEPVTYPLEQAGEVIAMLETRTATGKLVLTLR